MASHKTPFDQYDLIPLKNMVGNSSPQQIRDVGEHWKSVHQELNEVATQLQQAVQHATTHWEGAAAQGFAQKGGQIQQSLTNTAAHAQNTSIAMDYAASALQQTKSTMGGIKVPGFWDRVGKTLSDGFASSDEGLKRDLASGMNRIDAVNKNAHELSATEVAHQYAIGVMEHLGPQYTEAASYLDNPPEGDWGGGSGEAYPPPPTVAPPAGHTPPNIPMPQYPEGHPKDLPPPGYVPPKDPGQQVPSPWSPGQVEPRPPGTPPTQTLPGWKPPTPPSTGLDGWTPPETPGLPGGGGGGLPGGVGTLPAPGTGGGGGGVGGGGLGGGYVPGMGGGIGSGGGGVGGGRGGGIGSGGGRTGGLGTGGGGKVGGAGGAGAGGAGGAGKAGGVGGAGAVGAGGAGAAGGRGAAGGMAGGMGGGMGGAGGGAKGGAKGGSGLVRKAGGTIGGAKAGGAGGRAFTEGGSGIGKGRAAGQGGAAGMHGAPGSGGANRKKKAEGHRPDYLTEDEETWRGGTANPPVIE
ncbi:PPE domain-containing protein [Kitasatospora sp. NPDC004531]